MNDTCLAFHGTQGKGVKFFMRSAKEPLVPFFSKNPLDRMDYFRGSIDNFLATIPSDYVFYILVSGDKLIIRDNETDYLFSHDEVVSMGVSNEQLIFLGERDSIYYFSKSIEPTLCVEFNKLPLRAFVDSYPGIDEDMGILAQVFSILKWHETHQFCSACGSKNKLMHAGWRQDCSACGKEHFPRIDPVVIMLVTHGEYCLLGAGLNFQQQRYSCLAGFMEPGETIEDAARRELFEEAGVIGLGVRYMSSQPWPFPFNLMIGVHVEARDMALKINYDELADARWVLKSELIAVLNGSTDYGYTLPPRVAIARTLLDEWVKES
jgi:NAD+ diphosphatase